MEKTIDKFDLVTVVILSLIFLLVATWNLGINDAPVTTWYASEGQSFYMDLGIFKKVDALYVLLKQGVMSFTVHTGYPGNWDNEIEVSFDDYNEYYKWKEIDVNVETRFIRFVFRQSYGEISEIMVWGEDGQRIVAEEIIDENGQDATLGNLIDEQEKVDLPITYMARTYFDEVYYVRTAEDYLAHRYPYEWTHPPLGKIIIIAGILVFGFNPFGWRIMGVIFATLMIPVIYFLGKKLFGTWIGAFTSAFLLVFDFMHFTMGRMATVDTYAVFFSITSHLFFFKYLQNVQKNGWETSARPLFLAFVFFSLGFATKWYVMYGFLGEIFLLLALRFKDFLKLKNGWSTKFKFLFGRPLLTLLGFILVAIAIYFLIYIPDMIAGRTLKDVWNLQWAMYKYHSTLTATHPFSSAWLSWPFITRPVWLDVSSLPNGLISTIAAMGNPAVWWLGFMSIILSSYKTFKTRDFTGLFITVIFFSQWLIYAPISRCLFLYHFYVNVPFLCLAMAYLINDSWNTRKSKAYVLFYLLIVVVLFIFFYPVTSGYAVPQWWINHLKWLESWYF